MAVDQLKTRTRRNKCETGRASLLVENPEQRLNGPGKRREGILVSEIQGGRWDGQKSRVWEGVQFVRHVSSARRDARW
jgi:hypothetical protein